MKRYKAIAEYYDAENEQKRMLEEDVPFLLSKMPRRRQTILELAAGTGRAAIPLAQAGHRVIGVDYDHAMLEIARRKRDAVGISERDLSLVHQDMLQLRLKQRFDWIVILFNTFLGFPTLKEQDALLGVICDHLKPRGSFWLDIFNPDMSLLAQPHTENLDPGVFYVPGLDRTVHRTISIRREIAQQVQHPIFHYSWFDSRGVRHRQRTEFSLTWIFPRELQLLIERNGMVIEKLYGDYNGSSLKDESPRLIARCRRA